MAKKKKIRKMRRKNTKKKRKKRKKLKRRKIKKIKKTKIYKSSELIFKVPKKWAKRAYVDKNRYEKKYTSKLS